MSDCFTIPTELKARAQWMDYHLVAKDPPDPTGKQDKKPHDALTGRLADYTDSGHWCAYADALAAAQRGYIDGLAFVFSADDPYTGIDLDHSRDATTGELAAWALASIRRLDSYAEVSPSGTGVHVLARAKLPPGGRKRGDIEQYDEKRFFTVTGTHVSGTPFTINERQAEVAALHMEVFGAPKSPAAAPHAPVPRGGMLSDQEVLDKAMNAKHGGQTAVLWAGNTAGYPSASEADYALIGDLAFYTQDAEQLERLLQHSGLYRPEKHDKRNGQYASTLRRAVETLLERDRAAGRETYTPGRNGTHPVVALSPESQETYSTNARNAENGGGSRGYSAFSAFVECTPDASPEPDPAMYYGTAGDIIGGIAPHTEASPVALLVQILVCAGNAAGRHVYYLAEADRHYPNLYAVMVGDTAKARKGTSWDHIARVFREADPLWETHHIVGDLSSGRPASSTRCATWPMPTCPPATRASCCATNDCWRVRASLPACSPQKARDGNILSMVLRDGWDGGTLGALTNNSPERATNTHLSVIGHITQAELVKCLTSVDAQNGYANRFLFVATKRARLLPHGGDLDAIAEATAKPIRALRTALEWAKTPRKIAHDQGAFALWEQEYERLSTGQPGLFGAVTARAEAQVTRLALIYALLDCSPAVTADHLRAALAVWKFCEDSARYIFGDRLGDAVADRILEELRVAQNGLTRTEIYNLFDHNVAAAKIDAALASLKAAGLAVMTKGPTREKGRPPERWRAAKRTQETH